MNPKNDPIHKRLALFMEDECSGCNFVGISNDKEVYVMFKDGDEDLMSAEKKKIKEHFGEEIAKITTVVNVPMEEVTRLVDGLNQALNDTEEEKPQLLDIGRF